LIHTVIRAELGGYPLSDIVFTAVVYLSFHVLCAVLIVYTHACCWCTQVVQLRRINGQQVVTSVYRVHAAAALPPLPRRCVSVMAATTEQHTTNPVNLVHVSERHLYSSVLVESTCTSVSDGFSKPFARWQHHHDSCRKVQSCWSYIESQAAHNNCRVVYLCCFYPTFSSIRSVLSSFSPAVNDDFGTTMYDVNQCEW